MSSGSRAKRYVFGFTSFLGIELPNYRPFPWSAIVTRLTPLVRVPECRRLAGQLSLHRRRVLRDQKDQVKSHSFPGDTNGVLARDFFKGSGVRTEAFQDGGKAKVRNGVYELLTWSGRDLGMARISWKSSPAVLTILRYRSKMADGYFGSVILGGRWIDCWT
jgi:hypothetical protein